VTDTIAKRCPGGVGESPTERTVGDAGPYIYSSKLSRGAGDEASENAGQEAVPGVRGTKSPAVTKETGGIQGGRVPLEKRAVQLYAMGGNAC